jgi:bifunctional non-homologous end joining protein LigD
MSKAVRSGKVFIDWSQNSRHKSTIAVYSLRARERPTVSTPLTWDEVSQIATTRTSPLCLRGPGCARQDRTGG